MVSTGKVVRFDELRGYGFVTPDDGSDDVFVHVNDLDSDKHLLAPGVRVEYVAEHGSRGIKAGRVRIVESPKPVTRAAVPAVVHDAETTEYDGSGYAGVSTQQFSGEVTEALLHANGGLTAEQILDVREVVIRLARSHRWLGH